MESRAAEDLQATGTLRSGCQCLRRSPSPARPAHDEYAVRTLVRAVFVNSDIDGPVRYNFEDLCNALFEFRRDELISSDTILEEFSKRAQKPILKGLEAFNLNTLNFARADDLLNIIQARGGIAAGNRMNWLLYTASFLALSHQLTPLNFYV